MCEHAIQIICCITVKYTNKLHVKSKIIVPVSTDYILINSIQCGLDLIMKTYFAPKAEEKYCISMLSIFLFYFY